MKFRITTSPFVGETVDPATCKHSRGVKFDEGVASCPSCQRASYIGVHADERRTPIPKGEIRRGTKKALKLMLEFNIRVEDYLLGLGAKWDKSDARNFSSWLVLDTPLGKVSFRPNGFTVFGRFDDPKVAARFGGNNFSGKWNHHMTFGDLETVEYFKDRVGGVLQAAAEKKYREHLSANGVRIVEREVLANGSIRLVCEGSL